jgi:hypothetical protein
MPATDWKEVIPDDETARFEAHAAVLGALQAKRAAKAPVARALHHKANVGVEATFDVLPDLPAHARQSMFATPATYRALVRFSNGAGRSQKDAKPDVRGIAVKLIGVPGKKLIPGLEDKLTQDFLAVRTTVVPMRNPAEFVTVVAAAESPALLPFKLIGKLGFGRGIGLIRALLGSLKLPMGALAATPFFSALPIKFGDHAVHYGFIPRDPHSANRGGDPNYLGADLAARLRDRPVEYDFKVRFFETEATTPIEDPTVEWKTEAVTIGRLTIPVQDVTSPRGVKLAALVEQLSFDPWHALADLRPLGAMMRARNHAYRVSTMARKAAPEPDAFPEL